MSAESAYALAADIILVLHTLFVAFVVFGLVTIYAGYWLSWAWVRNYWFRVLHLGGIALVVLESWVGVICPLTILEMELRERAGANTYSESFIQHWLQTILYYEAPGWVFMASYTAFAALVLASWFIVRPRRRGK
jgi:hypothetical protein